MAKNTEERLSGLKYYINKIKDAADTHQLVPRFMQESANNFIRENCKNMLVLIAEIETELKSTNYEAKKTIVCSTCPCGGDCLIQIEGDIFYCRIPPADMGGECKECDYFGVSALSALAREIIKLQERVKKLEESKDGV